MELPEAKFLRAPFALGVFPERAGDFFAAGAFFATAGDFLAAGFLDELATFFAGLDDLARAFVAFGREDFFTLPGFFELFFFGELAIFSGAPLVSRARAEAYLRAFPAGRKGRFPR